MLFPVTSSPRDRASAPRRRRFARLAACAALATTLGPLAGWAAASDATRLETTVRSFVQTQTRGLPGEVAITVEPLDPRSPLGPCTAYAPSLPSGARLWGRTAVAVRCLGPSSWEIYQPVRIQVFAPHLRTARKLTAGQQLGASDLSQVREDLTALPDSVLTDPAQAIGLRLRIGMAAGLPLLKEHLVIPPAVRQGQRVQIVASGSGFSVRSEGTALANAAEGAQVAVRTASGQTVRGTARAGGVVEVSF